MKTVVVLPAYQAEKTIRKTIQKIPRDRIDAIIVIDDCSTDKTSLVAQSLGIPVVATPKNLGYGGNLITCISVALSLGADVVVELHADGEYEPSAIPDALSKVLEGYDVVLGNRFGEKRSIGMYWWKQIGTKVLTFACNIALGTKIPDLHQGFRVYTKRFLQSLPYKYFSFSYRFSFELLYWAIKHRVAIASVPVATMYTGAKRGASWVSSFWYVVDVIKIVLFGIREYKHATKLCVCRVCKTDWYTIPYYEKKKYSVWYCRACNMGYTKPIPRSMSLWYPPTYFTSPSLFGFIKDKVFRMCQKRRVNTLLRYKTAGKVLDVGAGEGRFGKMLPETFKITNIDPFYNGEKDVRYVWRKGDISSVQETYDVITCFESLEHVKDVEETVRRVWKFLNHNGVFLIEYPRFLSFESRLFGSSWYHLDLPRHLSHMTDAGLCNLLKDAGFLIEEHVVIPAFEYAIWGFAMSCLSFFGMPINTDRIKKGTISILWIPLIPIIVVSFFASLLLAIVGASPIGFVVARKR